MSKPSRTLLPAALLVAASCTDAGMPLSPEPEPHPGLQAVACTVELGQETVHCGAPEPGTGGALGSGGIILGGQNVFVRLASTNVAAADGTLRMDVTVQNLIDQPLGTSDGETLHGHGVRIWFAGNPVALPAGTASVANPDGMGILTTSLQPYFQYDTILRPHETTAPKTWELRYTAEAQRITFTVYLAAEVEHAENRIVLTGIPEFMLVGDTARPRAEVRDPTGQPRPDEVSWRISDTSVVKLDSTGLLTAHRHGLSAVTAQSGSVEASQTAIVLTLDEAVTVVATPAVDTIDMGETIQLHAEARNLRGDLLEGPMLWNPYNIHVAEASLTGEIRGTYPGTTPVYVTRDWATDTVVIVTRPGPDVQWASVSAGQNHSCGVTTDGKGWCWGNNGVGQLGIGRYGGYGEKVPVAMTTDLRFSVIDAGKNFTCGIDTGGAGWCWGYGWHGQLGNGTVGYTDAVTLPVAVAGGHTFRQIDAGYNHACGITMDDRAYCWGGNTYGQLGNDTTSIPYGEPRPVAVVGGHSFRRISATRDFTCAITTSDDLYCWGDNEVGQLGDGAGAPGLQVPHPVAVAGGRKWRAVATADSHACAVTTAGQAFCWGQDQQGELGTGTAGASSNVPVAVASAEAFVDVGLGSFHSCATTADGRAYCWGYDFYAPLGRGTKESWDPHPTPAPVVGGVAFTGPIQGGEAHTCAMGAGGRAYCWGSDTSDQAGVQPDVEYCQVPGGRAPCQSEPRPVANPAPGGIRTGPGAFQK